MREMDRINKRKAYDERTLWLVEVMLDTNDRLIHGKAVAILHTMSEVSPEKSEDVDLYMSKIVAHEPDSGVKAVLTKEWDRMKKRR